MKEELKPIDIGNLEDKVVMIVDALRKSEDADRSNGYRSFFKKAAKSYAESLLRDFGYYMDTKKVGGVVPYGLSDSVSE